MNRGTRGRTAGIALALLAAALVAPGGDARGDGCSECGPPTEAQLAAHPDFEADSHYGQKDYVETSGGECDISIVGPPRVEKGASWLVLRGMGEVWNCPHSKSSDTVTVTVSESDARGWSLSAEASASLKFFGAGFGAKLTAAVSQQLTIKTVTTISKQITASYCHRIPWQAYFEVAEYTASVDYTMSRRFSWWTKNRRTGHKIHRHGEIWIPCDSGTAVLDAKAPISGHFHLAQAPCKDEECRTKVQSKELGYFPGWSPSENEEEEEEENEEEEPRLTSGDLPDPPAGIPPPPEGFEDYYGDETEAGR